MSREGWKKEVSDNFAFLAISDAHSLIDRIYDSIEAPKTCGSCKHLGTRYNVRGTVAYQVCDKGIRDHDATFGCVLHETEVGK